MSSPQYAWCLHCERAFEVPAGMELEEGVVDLDNDLECVFTDCDGMIWDLRTWDSFRELDRTRSVVPVHGAEYPLYAKTERTFL